MLRAQGWIAVHGSLVFIDRFAGQGEGAGLNGGVSGCIRYGTSGRGTLLAIDRPVGYVLCRRIGYNLVL